MGFLCTGSGVFVYWQWGFCVLAVGFLTSTSMKAVKEKEKAYARGENLEAGWKKKLKKLNRAIDRSCRADYRAWVDSIAEQLEMASGA
eukprot:COSAG02_NODE_15_length_56565_cov_56.417136_2_plen_88_part_00